MAFNISYKKSIERDISRLSMKEANRILNKIEEELSERAESFPILKGDFAGLRKLQVGDYPVVVFTVVDNEVLVLIIGNRRQIYKKEK